MPESCQVAEVPLGKSCQSAGVSDTEEEFRARVGERLRSARVNRGLTVNEFARLASVHASQISRFETGQRLPDAMTLVRLGSALNVPIDWILTGQTGETLGAVPPPPPPPRGLDLTLPGFLQVVSERGLARWSAEARKGEVPTVGEALHAVDLLQRSPDLANEKGEPRMGWGALFQNARSGSALPTRASGSALPTRAELFAHVARASDRTVALAASLLFDIAAGGGSVPAGKLEELRASASADDLGDALIGALSGRHALTIAADFVDALDPERTKAALAAAYDDRRPKKRARKHSS